MVARRNTEAPVVALAASFCINNKIFSTESNTGKVSTFSGSMDNRPKSRVSQKARGVTDMMRKYTSVPAIVVYFFSARSAYFPLHQAIKFRSFFIVLLWTEKRIFLPLFSIKTTADLSFRRCLFSRKFNFRSRSHSRCSYCRDTTRTDGHNTHQTRRSPS